MLPILNKMLPIPNKMLPFWSLINCCQNIYLIYDRLYQMMIDSEVQTTLENFLVQTGKIWVQKVNVSLYRNKNELHNSLNVN